MFWFVSWFYLVYVCCVSAINLKQVVTLTSAGAAHLLPSLAYRAQSGSTRIQHAISHQAVLPPSLSHSLEMIKNINTLPPSEQYQVKSHVQQSLTASKFFEHVLEKHCSCQGPGLITKVQDLQHKKGLSDPTVQFLHTVHIGTLRNNILYQPASLLLQRVHHDMDGFDRHFDSATREIVSVCRDKEEDISELKKSIVPSNSDDLLAAIQTTKTLQLILTSRFSAQGNTLKQVIKDFIKKYPTASNQLKQDLYFIADQRNSLLHDVHKTMLHSSFLDAYSRILLELGRIPKDIP